MQYILPAALQAWGVYEDRLIRAAGQYPVDTVPGRVSFWTDNTDLLADQSIQQRRFPDIRSPDDRDVATAGINSRLHDLTA